MKQRILHDTLGICLLCTVIAAVLVIDILDGTGSFLVFPDAREQTYAWSQHFARGWNAGYLPLWDPHIYSGRSFAGEMQTAVFYPLNWLWLALFSTADGLPVLAIELWVVLHFAIAAIGMYVLLRRLGCTATPALLGALAYALFGPVAERAAAQANIFAGLAWIPWALLATRVHLQSGRLLWSGVAGAVIGIQLLSGHAQPAFHAALLCGLMCAWEHYRIAPDPKQAALRTIRSGLPMVGALMLVAAPQIWLTLDYLADAYRWVGADDPIGPGDRVPYEVMSTIHLWHFRDLLALIDPWRIAAEDANTPHVGAVGWMLASLGLIALWRREPLPGSLRPHLPMFLLVGAVATIVALAWLPPLTHAIRVLPVVGDIRELGRHAILVHVALCLLVAAGASRWLTQSAYQRDRVWLLAWPAIGFSAWALRGFGLVSAEAMWTTLAASLALLASGLLPQRLAGLRGSILLAAMIFSAWLYPSRVLPRTQGQESPASDFAALPLLAGVESEYGLARMHIDASAGLPKNYANVRPLQSRLGHSATMHRPYFDLLGEDWSMQGWVYDVLNIRYVLSGEELDFELVGHDEERGLRLYRRASALPRVFKLDETGEPRALEGQESFRLTGYGDHEISFEVDLAAPTTIVLSEIDVKGWCVSLDGRRVEGTRPTVRGRTVPLRALQIGAGKHVVEYDYRPFARIWGACRSR